MPRTTAPVLDATGTPVTATLYEPGRTAAVDALAVALSNEDKAALDGMSAKLPATLGAKAAAAALPTVATPFEPTAGSTVSHSVSTTALAAVACTAGSVIRFGNSGALPIGIRFGASDVAAVITAPTSMDIMPGTAEVFTVPPGVTHWSAIMASGSGTLKTTFGVGS